MFNEYTYLDHLFCENITNFVLPVFYIKNIPNNRYDMYFLYGDVGDISPELIKPAFIEHQMYTNCFSIQEESIDNLLQQMGISDLSKSIKFFYPNKKLIGCFLSSISLQWYLKNFIQDSQQVLRHKTDVSVRTARCLCALVTMSNYNVSQLVRDILLYGLAFEDSQIGDYKTVTKHILGSIFSNTICDTISKSLSSSIPHESNVFKGKEDLFNQIDKIKWRNKIIFDHMYVKDKYIIPYNIWDMIQFIFFTESYKKELTEKEKTKIQNTTLKKLFAGNVHLKSNKKIREFSWWFDGR